MLLYNYDDVDLEVLSTFIQFKLCLFVHLWLARWCCPDQWWDW